MLERERTSLFRMTFQTRLFIPKRLVDHVRPRCHPPGRRGRAMRIVAVSASHESFVHPVLERHRKVSANVLVTAVTKLRLTLRQKEFGRVGLVNGMTVGADDSIQCVLRSANICQMQRFRVALEAFF